MRNYFPILTFLFAPVLLHAQQVTGGLANPESVVAYRNGYFVSNIGPKLDPMAKDGDGSIAWITDKGKLETTHYFEDVLNAPKGLEVIGNTLYVADIDHLKGYDIATKKKVFDLNLEGKAGLLNDLTKVSDSALVVSDSFKGDVLLVNTRTAAYTSLKGNVDAANGIAYDATTDMVYLCSMGAGMDGSGKLFGKKLHDADAAFAQLENSPTGLFDGLVLLDGHRLLASDWITVKEPTAGRLWVYDLNSHQSTSVATERSPADIALGANKRTLLIPQMLDNQLKVQPLKTLKL
ncbi:hypothetical protein [Chitinophaga sp. 212800010-3]|uniref:hypothetical protein n=1 Tax=unclassified Chitinophaga TaxID=2619133 RepID=UPI002DEAB624|nr:ATP-binding protein [Chitinophaga sp. 212800010-3]